MIISSINAGAMRFPTNWPYTLIGIMPSNRKLKAIAASEAGAAAA
jgi:hypothetical protein